MMTVVDSQIPAVKLVQGVVHIDDRGAFSEVYHYKRYSENGIEPVFVQDNHSISLYRGTVRGLHFQTGPCAQDKLVRVVKGAIFDVAVDLRRNSPTFGRHVALWINAEDATQVFIPAGFAHGFCTLEPATEVVYKASHYYSPAHDGGIAWNDPALAIEWPIDEREAVVSEKDRNLPRLAEIADRLGF